MVDVREQILLRVLVILWSLVSGVNVYRNRTQFPEDVRPCFVLIDGDEEANQNDNDRFAFAPRRMEMNFGVFVLVSDDSDTVGSTLNGYRRLIIDAMLSDQTLANFTTNNCGVGYEGCSFSTEESRNTSGQMGLTFSVQYVLKPEELV